VEMRDMMLMFYGPLAKDWSDEEKAQFKEEMLKAVQERAKEVVVEDGENGSLKKVGLVMTAIVVVARK